MSISGYEDDTFIARFQGGPLAPLPSKRSDERVQDAALPRIPSFSSSDSLEYECRANQEDSLTSKVYHIFAGLYTVAKVVLFGQTRHPSFDFDIEAQHVQIPRERYVRYQHAQLEYDLPEPSLYDKVKSYVWSVYEKVVFFFYELFGIDD